MADKSILKTQTFVGADLSVRPFPWLSPLWEAVFWKIMSCASFAGINVIVRYLEGGSTISSEVVLPANIILFFQNIFGVLLMTPFLLKRGFPRGFLPLTSYPKLHGLRVVMAVIGVWLWYLTLKNMPIAEGVALSFTGPVFTVIGAKLWLGESLGSQRFLAILLSIIGAFMITRPDIALLSGETHLGWVVLLPLASAMALVLSKLLTRQLATLGESPEQLSIFLLLGMIPVSGLPAVYNWVTPVGFHWPWLMILGVLSAIAHLSFSKAYQLAEVSFLMPFGFSKFLFSMCFGFYFFSEFPKPAFWLGLSIISVSLFLLAYKISLYSMAKRFKSNWFKNKE